MTNPRLAAAFADNAFLGMLESDAPAPASFYEQPALDPKNWEESAREFVERKLPNLLHLNGDWLNWEGGAYRDVEHAGITSAARLFLNAAKKAVPVKGKSGEVEFHHVPFKPNAKDVSELTAAVRDVRHVSREHQSPPCWLPGHEGVTRPAVECISCRNGILHLPSGDLLKSSPNFFTRTALDYDYVEDAEPPKTWIDLLREYWPRDRQSIDTLQEWFGYSLSGNTSLQKILFLLGPPRSGKGTIGRTLTRVIGANNVTAPSINSLGSTFGLEPLISKRLAIIPDARVGRMSDSAAIAEKLLSISGEDQLSIPRKYKSAWEGRLDTRLVLMANEVPSIGDDSGALGHRLVILPMSQSFLGKEDPALESKIAGELPGILRWAIEGYRNLQKRGRFDEPATGVAIKNSMLRLSSAVRTFTEDECVIEPGASVTKEEIFDAWGAWCRANGNRLTGGKEALGTKLLAVHAGKVSPTRLRVRNGRPWGYAGIRLRVPGGAATRADESADQEIPF